MSITNIEQKSVSHHQTKIYLTPIKITSVTIY